MEGKEACCELCCTSCGSHSLVRPSPLDYIRGRRHHVCAFPCWPQICSIDDRYNESRAAAETAAEKGWDVYIGSHDVWKPVEFLSQLQTLGDEKASAAGASEVKSSPSKGIIDSEV